LSVEMSLNINIMADGADNRTEDSLVLFVFELSLFGSLFIIIAITFT